MYSRKEKRGNSLILQGFPADFAASQFALKGAESVGFHFGFAKLASFQALYLE
ncbi:hypothetical protein [Herbaspirillum rubrisubalbicans]|uniref:hypothetical protein n=1 Tax=Herbaspirillum rubrisubalbicans TaxID=80842 RepID=UPI0015C5597D|nr:hypothetical protein [Herbaspirillum rubrisubalbicans]